MIIPGMLLAKPAQLRVDDIHCFTANKNEILIHTPFGIHRPLISLQDYSDFFGMHGFEMLNKSALVQMNKIKHYDRNRYVVTFDDEPPSQGCFVSRRNRYKVRNMPE